MYPILQTCETALANLCSSASVSASLAANIYTGLGYSDKAAPAVICSADNASEDFPESGIWHCSIDVIVKEAASDTTGSLGNLANVIFEKIQTTDTGSLSSQATNFFVYDIDLRGCNNTQDGDAWVQTLSLDVICALT